MPSVLEAKAWYGNLQDMKFRFVLEKQLFRMSRKEEVIPVGKMTRM